MRPWPLGLRPGRGGDLALTGGWSDSRIEGMKLNILGISCFHHDSAASLVRDGEILAAAQEKRFTRKKHDPR